MKLTLPLLLVFLIGLSSCSELASPSGSSRKSYRGNPSGGNFRARPATKNKAPQMGYLYRRPSSSIYSKAKYNAKYAFSTKDKRYKLKYDQRTSSPNYSNIRRKEKQKEINRFAKGGINPSRKKSRSSGGSFSSGKR